jgi:hypothetical protein
MKWKAGDPHQENKTGSWYAGMQVGTRSPRLL